MPTNERKTENAALHYTYLMCVARHRRKHTRKIGNEDAKSVFSTSVFSLSFFLAEKFFLFKILVIFCSGHFPFQYLYAVARYRTVGCRAYRKIQIWNECEDAPNAQRKNDDDKQLLFRFEKLIRNARVCSSSVDTDTSVILVFAFLPFLNVFVLKNAR